MRECPAGLSRFRLWWSHGHEYPFVQLAHLEHFRVRAAQGDIEPGDVPPPASTSRVPDRFPLVHSLMPNDCAFKIFDRVVDTNSVMFGSAGAVAGHCVAC